MIIRFLDEFDISLNPNYEPAHWYKSTYELKDYNFLKLNRRK